MYFSTQDPSRVVIDKKPTPQTTTHELIPSDLLTHKRQKDTPKDPLNHLCHHGNGVQTPSCNGLCSQVPIESKA
jgi:hypothetical protein